MKRRAQAYSPLDAVSLYCSTFKDGLSKALLREFKTLGFEVDPPVNVPETTIYGRRKITIAFEMTCSFCKGRSRSTDDVEFRVTYKWHPASQRKWRSRTMKFELDTNTETMVAAVAADIVKRAI